MNFFKILPIWNELKYFPKQLILWPSLSIYVFLPRQQTPLPPGQNPWYPAPNSWQSSTCLHTPCLDRGEWVTQRTGEAGAPKNHIMLKNDKFNESFFPHITKLWNSLGANVQNKNHASVTQMAQQLTWISSLNILHYVILIPVLFGRLDPNWHE